MEMHVLPQKIVFDLAAKAGCVPLEVQPDHCVGMARWISNTFIFGKSATRRESAGAEHGAAATARL
jgi:hypothetical protein